MNTPLEIQPYKPYISATGPTKEQQENNTRFLAQELKKLGIDCIEDRSHAEELWGEPDLNIAINNGIETIYVGFDRFGFCADYNELFDNVSLERAIAEIQEWLNN